MPYAADTTASDYAPHIDAESSASGRKAPLRGLLVVTESCAWRYWEFCGLDLMLTDRG